MLLKNNYKVINLDSTVVAQEPKLSPHIMQMRAVIASAMQLDIGCISVKATTEERLGFTGAGEGIAAHCVCLLQTI